LDPDEIRMMMMMMMMWDQLSAKKKKRRETPHSISKMEDILDIPTSNKLRNHMF
jgi:hypothetical protein